MFELLFWSAALFVIYVYVGYPILISIASRIWNSPTKQAEIRPAVSLVTPAYNEEGVIAKKIESCLSLDYPADKLEIIVATDGSTDRTVEIVSRYHARGVKLSHSPCREGKVVAVDRAIRLATGEIIVNSDAKASLATDALKRIVRHFHDPSVGCVSGKRAIVLQRESGPSLAENLYARYESFLKKCESALHSCAGAEGQIYAFRKSLYPGLLASLGSDDFYLPLKLLANSGCRLIYEPEAVAFVAAGATVPEELRRKLRIRINTLSVMKQMWPLLVPFRSPVWWQLLSHVMARYLVPPALVVWFASSAVLSQQSAFYVAALITQGLFYLFAALGWWLETKAIRVRIFYVPFYFVFMHLAMVWGTIRFFRGSQAHIWEPTQRVSDAFPH
ncbi:MAG TPA: glycosyltransferase family 2 protein [Candidatus Acidoferrales bacterium]